MSFSLDEMISDIQKYRPDSYTSLTCRVSGLSGFTHTDLFDGATLAFDARYKDQIIIDWNGYEIAVFLDDEKEGFPMRVRVTDQKDFEEKNPFVDTLLPTLETD